MDEAALHDLLSGRRQDFVAKLFRCGLHIASWGYASAMAMRNHAYDHRWMTTHRAAVPVISIGNITTGGTGKTPLAAWLANWLVAAGHRPGLLSRGYRSLDSSEVANRQAQARQGASRSTSVELTPGNDEKLVLDRLCPGVPHLQRRDRVSSAREAVAEFDCEVLLLDDGFQHRRLHRDLDLVLIDALQPWGYGHVLPRGLLRESLSGLRRSDLIIVTRANQCLEEQRQVLLQRLREFRNHNEIVEIAFVPHRLVNLEWQPNSLDFILGKRAISFCGIGNPAGFHQTVASLGVDCHRSNPFPDHHHYDSQDLRFLENLAHKSSAEVVVTTQKDLVKIASGDWHGPPLFAIEIGVEFLAGKELLESRLRQLFPQPLSGSVSSGD